MASNLVQVEQYYDSWQAHLARGLVEASGLPCFLFDVSHVAVAWHYQISLGGIRLMAFKEDAEKVKAVLNEVNKLFPSSQKMPLLPPTASGKWAFFVSFLATWFFSVPVILKEKTDNELAR